MPASDGQRSGIASPRLPQPDAVNRNEPVGASPDRLVRMISVSDAYLTEPTERPPINDFWNSRKSTINGSTTSVEAAIIRLNRTS